MELFTRRMAEGGRVRRGVNTCPQIHKQRTEGAVQEGAPRPGPVCSRGAHLSALSAGEQTSTHLTR